MNVSLKARDCMMASHFANFTATVGSGRLGKQTEIQCQNIFSKTLFQSHDYLQLLELPKLGQTMLIAYILIEIAISNTQMRK